MEVFSKKIIEIFEKNREALKDFFGDKNNSMICRGIDALAVAEFGFYMGHAKSLEESFE
eukprot:NODE_3317_length_408_cov_210.799443_g2785_i0.p1 GENE.NODE_3317_length_408_cov_210.799443_g2785_i0~~NODE_3317_length_408_cov_210.799443_g2785_i0.p1  ORF type:complete len:59 (+),score=1.66 NODE_3317_length_408_cov_210.799443_g2785_i0:150-326(+)